MNELVDWTIFIGLYTIGNYRYIIEQNDKCVSQLRHSDTAA